MNFEFKVCLGNLETLLQNLKVGRHLPSIFNTLSSPTTLGTEKNYDCLRIFYIEVVPYLQWLNLMKLIRFYDRMGAMHSSYKSNFGFCPEFEQAMV